MSDLQRTSERRGALHGRRIVITGAASGIGLATARRFLEEGAAVSLLDRNGAALRDIFKDTTAHCFECDITDESAVEGAIDGAAGAMDGIDGLVNAAGIMDNGSILEMPVARWRQLIDVNLVGTYLLSRACVRRMADRSQASIVNVGSGAGLLPNAPGLTGYAASKGAVVNFTRCLAAEVAPRIRVNSVCPGMVDTPMADPYRENVGNYALKRMADPSEIAAAILFLTSSEASYITGVALAVDGGRTFH